MIRTGAMWALIALVALTLFRDAAAATCAGNMGTFTTPGTLVINMPVAAGLAVETNCTYIFDAGVGGTVVFYTNGYSIDPIVADRMSLYGGSDTNAPLLAVGAPQYDMFSTVYSANRTMTLVFTQAPGKRTASKSYTFVWASASPSKFCGNNSMTTITTTTGYFATQLASTFDYHIPAPRNWRCSWLVNPATAGQRVTLTLNYFNMAPGDLIKVVDLASNNLTTYYDISNIISFIGATGTNLLVTWTTTAAPSTTYGFRFNTAQTAAATFCNGVYAAQTGSSGTIASMSPSFQSSFRYPPNRFCAFAVNVTAGSLIRLTSGSVYNGYKDPVIIYDGPSAASPVITLLSGSTESFTVITSSRFVYVTFQSNNDTSDDQYRGNSGFNIAWTAVSAATNTPTLPRPAYPNPCSGVVTLTTNTFTVGSLTGSAPGYDIGLVCGWVYKSTSGPRAFKISITGDRICGDQLTVYTGPNNGVPTELFDPREDDGTNSLTSSSSLLTSSYFWSSTYVPGLGTSILRYVYGETLIFEFRSDGFQDYDPSGFTVTIQPIDNYASCSATGSAVPPADTVFGYPSSDGSSSYRYPPNVFCTWFINPGTPFIFNSGFVSIAANDTFLIYEGNSTSGNIIYNSTGTLVYGNIYVRSGQAFMVFQSDASPTNTNYYGFSISYSRLTPSTYACDAGLTALPFTYSTINVQFPDQTGQAYTGTHDCQWLYQAQPGSVLSLAFSMLSFYLGDYVTLYDGANTSSPMIGRFAASQSSSTLTGSFVPTQCNILIRVQTNGTSFNPNRRYTRYQGMSLQISASLNSPSAGLCPLTAATSCTGGTVASTTDLTSLASCVWLTGTITITSAFTGVFSLPNLQIITSAGQILCNSNYLINPGLQIDLPQLVTCAGTIFLQSNYLTMFNAPLLKYITTFRLYVIYSYGQNFQLVLPSVQSIGTLSLTQIYCGVVNVTMPSLSSVNTLTVQSNSDFRGFFVGSLSNVLTATITNNPQLTAVNFTSLARVGTWQYVQNGVVQNDYPSLRIIDTDFQFSGAGATALRLPALSFAKSLRLQNSNVLSTVDLSVLATAPTLEFTSVGVSSVYLPSLVTSGSISLNSLASLATVYIDAMTTGQIVVTSCTALTLIRMNLLSNGIIGIATGNTNLQTILTPSLLSATITIATGNPRYTVVDFPTVQSATTISVSSLDVTTVNMPSLQTVDSLSLVATRLSTVTFPALTSVRAWTLQQSIFVTQILAPRLQSVTGPMLIADTIASSISLPALASVTGSLTIRSNYALAAFFACNLQRATAVAVVTNPLLSCYETARMFAGASVSMVQGVDCDATIRGTFGCSVNFTRTVNTTACGFTVACIQDAINGAYSNASVAVSIPAGTYTGCSAPLSMLGRVLVLRGQGIGVSVIDCEGAGTAFVANSLETPATLIEGISFINGYTAGNGGAFTIIGASPTFTDVEFATSRAGGSGGAGYISGGTPTFLNCLFRGNAATSGGSLYATGGAAPSLRSVTVQDSIATSIGGGVAYVGVADDVSLDNVTLRGNRGQRGGGLYADVQMTINLGVFTDNVATQFGGGIAAVPTNQVGQWLTVNEAVVMNNRASGNGAGLFVYSSSLLMTGGRVENNTAATNGGGIAGACAETWRTLNGIEGACPVHLNISGTRIVDNTVRQGSGGGLSATQIVVSLMNATVAGNYALVNGGGVYASETSFEARSSLFAANTADTNGGGVYCSALDTCAVLDSSLTENYATAAGGAVFYCLSSCLGTTAVVFPDLTNTLFDGNAVGFPRGYGNTTATDPAALTWLVAPDSEVVSGAAFVMGTADRSMRVLIQDAYGHTVSSSINVLQLALSTVGGADVPTLSLVGPTTVLAGSGQGVFAATSPVATSLLDTNTAYRLTCQHASIAAVTVSATFTLLPCALGQGAKGGDGLVCTDCLAGEYSGPDTNFTCTQCAPGSASSSTRAPNCTLCGVDTFQPTAGSLTCIACADQSHSLPGATVCVREDAPAAVINNNINGIVGSPMVYGIVAGIGGVIIVAFIVIGCCVYRRTRRKTMEKYYLDEDATVRRGVSESALGLAVRKLIGATTTTRIGGGEFTDVYKGRYNDQWVAVKVLKGEMVGHMIAQSEFRREVTALSMLGVHKHPGIIELKFFLERSPVCIGLEFCPNGSLKRSLKTLSLNVWDKVKMAAQTASAMTLLHNYNIVHMDLKTDNILLGEENSIKLADFGICKVLGHDGSSSQTGSVTSMNPIFGASQRGLDSSTANGALASQYASVIDPGAFTEEAAFTPQYCDPYRLLHEDDTSELTLKRADVFTFAMVMWAIWSQEEPFSGVEATKLMEQRRADPSMRPAPLQDPHKCYDRIMNKAWVTEPAARPTIHECLAELRECLRSHFGADLHADYLKIGEQQPLARSTADLNSMGSFNSVAHSASVFDINMQSMQNPMQPNRLSMAMVPPMDGALGSMGAPALPTTGAPLNFQRNSVAFGSTDSTDSINAAHTLASSFHLPPPPVGINAISAPPLPDSLPPPPKNL